MTNIKLRLRHLVRSRPTGFVRARIAWFLTRALARVNPAVTVIGINDGDARTFMHVSDSVITPWIIATGDFQRTDLEQVLALTEKLGLRTAGGAFLDIGANIGTTTLYAMRSGEFDRALCMEPAEANLDLIHLNLAVNDLAQSVAVIPAACDETSGTATMWITSGNLGDHRIARNNDQPSSHESSISVTTMSLDDAMRAADLDPADVSLVWVDTQGHEPAVMASATGAIEAGAPFSIEFWPGEYQRTGRLDSLLEILRNYFAEFIDLRDPSRQIRSIGELPELAARLQVGDNQTDILLFNRTEE